MPNKKPVSGSDNDGERVSLGVVMRAEPRNFTRRTWDGLMRER